MSTPFAIQVIGPAGAEWFLNEAGERVGFDQRAQFPTAHAANSILEHALDLLRERRFLVRAVNVEDQEEDTCEMPMLGEMACAF